MKVDLQIGYLSPELPTSLFAALKLLIYLSRILSADLVAASRCDSRFKWTKKREKASGTTDIARRVTSGCSRRDDRLPIRKEEPQRDVNDHPNKYQLCCSHCSQVRIGFLGNKFRFTQFFSSNRTVVKTTKTTTCNWSHTKRTQGTRKGGVSVFKKRKWRGEKKGGKAKGKNFVVTRRDRGCARVPISDLAPAIQLTVNGYSRGNNNRVKNGAVRA